MNKYMIFDGSTRGFNRGFLFASCLLAMIWMSSPSDAIGGVIFETLDGATVGEPGDLKAVSSVAWLDVVGGNLQITLKNTTLGGKGNITRLTNFEFDVSDDAAWSLLAPTVNDQISSVMVDLASTIVNSPITTSDISGGWVYGEDVSPAGFGSVAFDYGVSATAFHSGNQISRFDGSTEFGNYKDSNGDNWGAVNGGDWGLIGITNDTYTGASVRDTVIITLGVTGILNLSDIESVAFTYGSEQDGVYGMVPFNPPPPGPNPVPEPTSLAIFAVLGMMGVGVRRRRKQRQ